MPPGMTADFLSYLVGEISANDELGRRLDSRDAEFMLPTHHRATTCIARNVFLAEATEEPGQPRRARVRLIGSLCGHHSSIILQCLERLLLVRLNMIVAVDDRALVNVSPP
jgi:hypothetical protein